MSFTSLTSLSFEPTVTVRRESKAELHLYLFAKLRYIIENSKHFLEKTICSSNKNSVSRVSRRSSHLKIIIFTKY